MRKDYITYKKTDGSINAEKAFFHFTLRASMYYLDFDAVYSHIIREEYASLVRLLPNLANNISKNDAGAVSSLLLNNFYNEAFTNALSSVKARIPRVYSIANIVKYL